MRTEAERGEVQPQPKTAANRNHRKLEEKRKDLPLEPSEEEWPCRPLDFRLLASKTLRE